MMLRLPKDIMYKCVSYTHTWNTFKKILYTYITSNYKNSIISLRLIKYIGHKSIISNLNYLGFSIFEIILHSSDSTCIITRIYVQVHVFREKVYLKRIFYWFLFHLWFSNNKTKGCEKKSKIISKVSCKVCYVS